MLQILAFNHVECEIVKATKVPDCKHKQQSYLHRWPFEKQQRRRHEAKEKEKYSLCLDPCRIGYVLHGSRNSGGGTAGPFLIECQIWNQGSNRQTISLSRARYFLARFSGHLRVSCKESFYYDLQHADYTKTQNSCGKSTPPTHVTKKSIC
jgi:hypothetical protein